ncbi:phosphatase PAP2 family protein [Devosia sp.]|uniref:phosphatase PAP2 family protein n=1 Tax=Devosia sp. TaxID=1871048 RepID=UPI003264D1C3
MFDLTSPWPLGLNRGNWPRYAVGFGMLLAIVTGLDAWASQGAIHWPDALRWPFQVITDYGLSDWVLYPSLLVFGLSRFAMLVFQRWARIAALEVSQIAAFIFIGVGLPGLLSNLLKRIIGRGRPEVFGSEGAFSFQQFANDWTHQSFPSGHATTAIALAFICGFLWPRSFKPLVLIGLVVAISRVPVGMHYPTDVLGGAVMGALGAYGVRLFFASKGWLFSKQPDGTITRRPDSLLRRFYTRARR